MEIVVVGGGIAGASAAAFLAQSGSCQVTLLEQESVLAHHTTGRSAAQFVENLGADPIRPLTQASLGFFHNPPDGLADAPLLTPQPVIQVAQPGQEEIFEDILATGNAVRQTCEEISIAEAVELFPLLKPEAFIRALIERKASNIDVASTHQAFVRMLRRAGGHVATSERVDAATPDGSGWRVATTEGIRGADVIVNASGAWGDLVAKTAGVDPVGLQPRRRTAFMVKSPIGMDSAHLPMLINIDHDWYAKADGPQFLCSPADQTPSEPCDAKPLEVDIARAIDSINAATNLNIRSVVSQWAGLRTFAPDESMVIGPEPGAENFVWCVGQGGTGIQTSPGAGQLVANLVADGKPGDAFDTSLDLEGLLPNRFR